MSTTKRRSSEQRFAAIDSRGDRKLENPKGTKHRCAAEALRKVYKASRTSGSLRGQLDNVQEAIHRESGKGQLSGGRKVAKLVQIIYEWGGTCRRGGVSTADIACSTKPNRPVRGRTVQWTNSGAKVDNLLPHNEKKNK